MKKSVNIILLLIFSIELSAQGWYELTSSKANISMSFPQQPYELDTLNTYHASFSDSLTYYRIDYLLLDTILIDTAYFFNNTYDLLKRASEGNIISSQSLNIILTGHTYLAKEYVVESPSIGLTLFVRLVCNINKIYIITISKTGEINSVFNDNKDIFFSSFNINE